MKRFIHIIKSITILTVLFVCVNAQPANGQQKKEQQTKATKKAVFSPLDIAAIERITHLKGKESGGEYKITVPQNDLNVQVDSFKITPPMGLSSWVAFTPTPHGAMLMGDLVLTETDLKVVQQEVIRQGLTITAIHNHFVRNHPNVLYMHIDGTGATETMAQKVKAVLAKVAESRGGNPAHGTVSSVSVSNTLDTQKLDAILGHKGELNKGVYKHTIGRPDVALTEHGIPVTTFLGFNTWAAWQGSPEKAAVAGDFAMLENEVEGVVKTLIANGFEVVALHNHMIHEKPKIFFLHYWGTGNAESMAKGLKAALEMTGKKSTAGHSSTLEHGK